MKKNIPVGVSDFNKLTSKKNNYVFVDKSSLIKEVLNEKSEIALITRPRRWGKTLNMSMLEHFLSIEMPEFVEQASFDELEIARLDGGRYMQHNRKYPVIFISFKDIKQSNFDEAVEKVGRLIQEIFIQFSSHGLSSSYLNIYENSKSTNTHKRK